MVTGILDDEPFAPHGHTVRITVPLPGRVMVNSIGVVNAMAASGHGVALLPTFICQPSLAAGDLVHVLPAWQGRADPVHLVYPRQRFMPPKLRAFIDLAQALLSSRFDDSPATHQNPH